MYDLIVFLVLLVLGFIFGQISEKRHFRSIIRREREMRDLLGFTERRPPMVDGVDATLVCGSVVVSVDYFRRFVAGLRNFVGGRVSSYESLMERARREAVLRMKEQARAFGATSVWNIRLETASIAKGAGQNIASVEVMAYGTALKPH